MRRYCMEAGEALRAFPAQSADLVLTSPPAYPSMLQAPGALGTEPSLQEYLVRLRAILFRARCVLKPGGFMVLVVQPVPEYDLLTPLSTCLRRLLLRILTTVRWSHGDGTASWVIFLGKGPKARLNRKAPAWAATEWAMPRPDPDRGYNFYEWPDGLVEAVVSMTIPKGGRVIDPFAGKARALSRLPDEFEVVAVDVLPFDDTVSSASEARPSPLENAPSRGGGSAEPEDD